MYMLHALPNQFNQIERTRMQKSWNNEIEENPKKQKPKKLISKY